MTLTWPAKDPDEALDYRVNWSARLGLDTIDTSVFSLIEAAGLSITEQSNTTKASTVVLSGGTDGDTAVIQCRVTTAGDRTLEETIILPIVASATAANATIAAAAETPVTGYAAKIAALEEAMASGELTVEANGERVTYRSFSDMAKALAYFNRQLAGSTSGLTSTTVAAFEGC